MEQSYKEKYEQALAKAKEQYNYPCMRSCMGILEDIFPELAESEDEKVRQKILFLFYAWRNNEQVNIPNKKEVEKAIDWLEKQGDYANFRDKAQVGDRITKNEAGVLVNLSQLKRVAKPSEKQGKQRTIWHNEDEEPKVGSLILLIMQSGTPIVAKIIEPNHTFNHGERWAYIDDLLERQGEQKASYTTIVETGDGGINALVTRELPTDGEQNPTDKVEPFDKYEGLTDFERTLADICIGWIGEELGWKQYIKDNANVLLKIAVKKFNSVQDVPFEQKSAWSEEDEELLKWSIHNLTELKDRFGEEYGKVGKCIDWLKSLKDRVQQQPKQEWSEEDKDYYDAIIAKLEVTQEDASLTDNQMDFLKSLKPQKCLIPSDEEIEKAAQEWDSKANFNPFYMTMEGDKPTGVKQHITTHKESFKAGIYWILEFLKSQK